MKNKPPQKAEFVKNFIDRDGEVGELYKVGSEFFVVGWYRDDVERKPCKHNTIFTEVWQSDKKGKVGFGRDPIHEWLRWHSGKSIMARFLKSRACPPPAKILAQNGNTMTLQETINEVFAKHDAECLLLTEQRDEARQEIKLLRKERDAALAVVDEFIIDTTVNHETPIHECEFRYDPEKGKCDSCEAWGNYVGLFCSNEEEETP